MTSWAARIFIVTSGGVVEQTPTKDNSGAGLADVLSVGREHREVQTPDRAPSRTARKVHP
jgi:hypothetical protein